MWWIVPLMVCGSLVGHLGYLYTHREFKPNEMVSFLEEGSFSIPEREQRIALSILKQPFTYLDSGQQMTAYLSRDEKYVLKLFHPRRPVRERHFASWKGIKSLCSLHWLNQAYFKRKRRLKELFHRYLLGYQSLRKESALLYVHLNQQTGLDHQVEIIDKDAHKYCIDLQTTPFVLQERAELAGRRIARLLETQEKEGLEHVEKELRKLFLARARQGITDPHQTLHNNYGFIGDRAIQIDLGKIVVSEKVKAHPEEEVDRIMQFLHLQRMD